MQSKYFCFSEKMLCWPKPDKNLDISKMKRIKDNLDHSEVTLAFLLDELNY